MALSIVLVGLFVTVGVGIYSAWTTYMNLRKEDYEIDFHKLMSKAYLEVIKDKERLGRLLKVRRWTKAFMWILIFYLSGSLALSLMFA
ncbi:hypothetical protein ACJVC5_10410 [Peredibacter sp. HCB2-198]|uniref:hypothetical protein n=1 Tax=Peredibacter sp. HCB2-198 TaxID=3383025 RepID=UPI0038B669A5